MNLRRVAAAGTAIIAALIAVVIWRKDAATPSSSPSIATADQPRAQDTQRDSASDAVTNYQPSRLIWTTPPSTTSEAGQSDLLTRIQPRKVLATQTATDSAGQRHERLLVETNGRFSPIVVHRTYADVSQLTGTVRPAKEFAYAAGHLLAQIPSTSDRDAILAQLHNLGASAPKLVGHAGIYRVPLSHVDLTAVDDALGKIKKDALLGGLIIEPDFLVTTSDVLGATQVIQSPGAGLIDPVTQDWVRPAASQTTSTYGPDALAAQAQETLANLPSGARILQFEASNTPNSFRPGTLLQNFWTRTLDTSDLSSVYIQSAYTSGYPLNGGNYVRVLSSDQGLEFAHKDGLPFQVHQIDLAEYSTVFTAPATITFTGFKADGTTVTQIFRTDGIIDGTGPAVDFQTFTFPDTFKDLVKLRASNPPYMMDNIVVTLAGQETPLPTPPDAPVVYKVNWNEDAVNASPSLSGAYAISSINFGYPKVRSAVGALADRPLELIAGGSVSYGQIRFDLGHAAERYVLEVDALKTAPSKSFALFFDGNSGFVRMDFNSTNITVMGSSANIPYTAGQVNRVRVEVFPSARKLILSLNGTQVLNLSNISDIGDVQTVRFSLTDPSATGGVAIDNLLIEAHAPAAPPVSAPKLKIYPANSLSFPSTSVGGEVLRFITLTNTGTTNLVISSITSNHSAFLSPTDDIPPLPPGGSYYHYLTFRPQATGSVSGQLTINSNAPDSPATTLDLQGSGLGVPAASLAPALLNARIVAGTRGTESFGIRNTGTDTLSWRLVRTDTTGLPPPAPLATNDPSLGSLWGLGTTETAGIDATRAWRTTTGSSSTLIAVIDTGVSLTHSDLVANIDTNPREIPANGIDDDNNGFIDDVHGWNFSDDTNNPDDRHGHGTHVAGTIAAKGNNNLGVVGVAWSARILPVQFLSASGVGYTSDALQAVDYARIRGARLINASWGGGGYSALLHGCIQQYVTETRGLFIAAAGNNASDNDLAPFYPAGYAQPGIISVAATASNDTLAYFSNFGRTTVHVAAPGQSILSCYLNNGYAFMSGTSMAAPHITGSLALLQAQNPHLSGPDQKTLLTDYVDYAPALNSRVSSDGRINIWRSLNRTMSPWLSPAATFGTVSPGSTSTVDLQVDATALTPGTYSATLAFQTNDPYRSLISLPVQLSVTADNAFNQWTRQNFGRADLLHASTESTWSATSDPDNDSLPNALEYILGRSATVAESTIPLSLQLDADGKPFVTVELIIQPAGVTWVIEWSPTLASDSWTVSGITVEELSRNEASGLRVVRARFTDAQASPARAFFRLRAAATN